MDSIGENERVCAVGNILKLIEDKRSLPFGTDALLLAASLRHIRTDAVELGAGSGIVSLVVASRQKVRSILAVELRSDMVNILKRNIELNSLSGKVTAYQCDLRLLPKEYNCSFGAVLTNPPYMKAQSGKEGENDASNASRREHAGTIDDFCACGARLLKFGGSFYCVYRPERLCDLFEAMRAHGLEPKRATMVYASSRHSPCLVLVEAKKGAKPSLEFTPPLYLQDEFGKESEDYQYIMQNGTLPF